MSSHPVTLKNPDAPFFTSADDFLRALLPPAFAPVLEFLNGEVTVQVNNRDAASSFLTSTVSIPPKVLPGVLQTFQRIASFLNWKPTGRRNESLSLVIRIECAVLKEALAFLRQTVDAHQHRTALSQQRMFQI